MLGPRSPKSWPAPGPALAQDHRPFPVRPEGGSRGVGAGVGANLRGSAARRVTPASCLSPRLRYAWSPALSASPRSPSRPQALMGAQDWVRWPTSSGSRGPSGPQGLACGELPHSVPVPAYPRATTPLPSPLPAVFRGLLSGPSASLPSFSSLNSFPELHVGALPARIPGTHGQLLTPGASTLPFSGPQFPLLSRGVKTRENWGCWRQCMAFPFLWGKTARAEPTPGCWSSRSQTAP